MDLSHWFNRDSDIQGVGEQQGLFFELILIALFVVPLMSRVLSK